MTQKLPQIYFVILRICIGKVRDLQYIIFAVTSGSPSIKEWLPSSLSFSLSLSLSCLTTVLLLDGWLEYHERSGWGKHQIRLLQPNCLHRQKVSKKKARETSSFRGGQPCVRIGFWLTILYRNQVFNLENGWEQQHGSIMVHQANPNQLEPDRWSVNISHTKPLDVYTFRKGIRTGNNPGIS